MYSIKLTYKDNLNIPNSQFISDAFFIIHNILSVKQDKDGLVNIGIGFPEHCEKPINIGSQIVLCGNKDDLIALNLEDKLFFMKDYCNVHPVMQANEENYVQFMRRHAKTKNSLIRRRAKRKGIPLEQAVQDYQTYNNEAKKLPFVWHKSKTSQQTFPLYIKKEETNKPAIKFNTFGFPADSGGVVWA